MSNIKIKSKNLNVYYGDKQALFDVNLDLNEKEVTALIGPSGCGKSTFIRCINRMNDVIDICKVTGNIETVSYTHLRAHETKANLVCRLLLEKKK